MIRKVNSLGEIRSFNSLEFGELIVPRGVYTPVSVVGTYGGIETPVPGCGQCPAGYWNAGGPPLLHWTRSNAGIHQKKKRYRGLIPATTTDDKCTGGKRVLQRAS